MEIPMFPPDDIQKSAKQMVARAYTDTAPGAALLLGKKGQIIFREGTGLANLEHQVPLTPDMPFRLASLTKPLTSTAILMLVEAGELALTDSLNHFLPDYPMGETTITIEHLLTHTSGIPDYTELPEWWAIHRQDLRVDQLIDLFKVQPKAFAPGTRWAYSNSGYVLLGAILETISGVSYGKFMAEHIFTPLGMSNTSYEATSSRVIPHMANGYSKAPEGHLHPEYLSYTHLYASGGLVSTLDDLARWYAALHEGRLLTPETLRRMWTPYRLADGTSARYGYGWWLGECRGQPAAEHFGSMPGYAHYLLSFPEDDVLSIVLSNNEGKLNHVEQLAVGMAGLALGKPYQPPATFPLSPTELSHFAGSYLTREGRMLTVVDEAGHLILQGAPEERFVLQAVSPREFFFSEIPESRLIFSGTKDGVSGFDWVPRRGIPIHALKTH
jgi:Beta-lactamase class C and other penicillin binding proteins